jgi:hypothetical protein
MTSRWKLKSRHCGRADQHWGGPVIAVSEIAPGDLDIAIVSQLPSSQLPFNCKLEAGPLEVEGFQATLRGRRLIKQSPKDTPMDADGALVFAEHHG